MSLSSLYVRKKYRASIMPMKHSLRLPALGSNVHHQLEKTLLAPYLTALDSHARQPLILTSSSMIYPPPFLFSGSTDSPGLENRPSRKRSLSDVVMKTLWVQVSSVHDLATAATCSSYSQPLLFSSPISATPFGMRSYWQSRKIQISAATFLHVSSNSLSSSHFEPRNPQIALSCARS